MVFEAKKYKDVEYLVRYPKNFKQGEKYPVIFTLHGAGFRGNNVEKLKEYRLFTCTERNDDLPFVIVVPQCNKNTWFDHFETLKELALEIASADFTDAERYYLMGVSMGGYGTWQLAMSCPELFAAIVPICGGGMYWNASRLVNVPVWAFHGGKDETVLPEESIKMVEAVKRAGGNAELTIYPEHKHDVWTDTFSNPRVFEWLLEHTNSNAKQIVDSYRDGVRFG